MGWERGTTFNDNATILVNNAGGGNYGFDGSQHIAWGYNPDFSDPSLDQSNALNFSRDSANAVYEDGAFVTDPGAGIPNKSTGYAITQNFDILSMHSEDGSSFSVEFESHAGMFVGRNSGDADARFSLGPGMEGQAQLVVHYEIWQATVCRSRRPESSSCSGGYRCGGGDRRGI